MKIIYCADILGDFARLYTLLKETIADLYIIAGNLLDMPFYTRERFDRLKELQAVFNSRFDPQTCAIPGEYAFALKDAMVPPDISPDDAREFLDLYNSARQSMLKKYIRLETILGTKPYVPILVIPGGSDLPLEHGALKDRSIDMKTHSIGGITVAGMGGGGNVIPGFPLPLLRGAAPVNDTACLFPENTGVSILAGALPLHMKAGTDSNRSFLDCGYPVSGNVPLFLCGASGEYRVPGIDDGSVHVYSPSFGDMTGTGGNEGGFFNEILFDGKTSERIMLKKIVSDRIHDIAHYTVDGGKYTETHIDRKRFDALLEGSVYDSSADFTVNIPELRLFRDIRNFFKIHQTRETEMKISSLADALEKLPEEYSDVALDLVGSTNIGIAQRGSDVDMVLYIRGGGSCLEDGESCFMYDDIEQRIRDIAGDSCEFELIDRVNLDLVEESIRSGDSESPVLQRFVVYRGMCRPVNYRVLAPVEDLLNSNKTLRAEAESSMSEYLQVFGTTKDTNRSFDKYLTRLKAMGVEIPPVLAGKIRDFLQK